MFAIIGEALMDMVITNDGKQINAHIGGGPFNTAIALARLNQKVCFHYPISTDYYGRRIKKELEKNKIEYSCPYVSEYSTPLAMVHVDENGKADYRFYRHKTAERDLNEKKLIANFPKNIKAVHTGTLAIAEKPDVDVVERILRKCKKRNIIVSIDPNVREKNFADKEQYRQNIKNIMKVADIIKCSDDDIQFIYPNISVNDACEKLFEEYESCPIISVTGGGKFIKAKSYKAYVEMEPNVKNISGDTIGAGDCYSAGLLYQCSQDNLLECKVIEDINEPQLKNIVTIADKIAGLNCQKTGCNPPYLEELREI